VKAETTTLAEVSSGRSEAATRSSTQDDRAEAFGATVSTEADPPMPAAAKAAVRTVKTFFASPDFTVWIALPA